MNAQAELTAIDDLDYPLHIGAPGYRVVQATRRALEQRRLPVCARLLGINKVVVEQGLSYPKHKHSDYEVIFVEAGPYRCRVDDVELCANEGEAVFLRPGNTHEVRLEAKQRHTVLQFRLLEAGSESGSPIAVIDPDANPSVQVVPVMTRKFLAILDQMQKEGERQRPFSPQVQDSLLQQAWWLLVDALPRSLLSPAFRQQSSEQVFLQRLLSYIENHIDSRLSMDGIAQALDISKSTLIMRCRAMLGEPPSRVYMRARVRHAAALLVDPRNSVKEVSYRLGFQNPYHFSRVFKAFSGYPPSRAR